MPTWLKWTLGIGGGLFALKLINDSKGLADMLKSKANTSPATNFVGGHTLPTPTHVEVSVGEPIINKVVTAESTLGDANPSTEYKDDFMGLA